MPCTLSSHSRIPSATMLVVNSRRLHLVLAATTAWNSAAFAPVAPTSWSRDCSLALSDDAWAGEVVSNDPTGRIRGCQLQNVGDSPSDWEISIDGDQADLGKFSEAIYKKITQDAKQQRYVTIVLCLLYWLDILNTCSSAYVGTFTTFLSLMHTAYMPGQSA